MSLNTSAVGQGQGRTDKYGHADYNRDKAAGMSDYEIKQLIDADQSRMGNGGTSGELYQQISAGARPPSNNNNNSGGGGGYRPPSNSGGTIGREGYRKAYGPEFQENLNAATQQYRPEDKGPAMDNPDYKGLGKDFRKQLDRETAIRDNDPFGDSWNSIDFFGKHLTMGREAQKGRGDGTNIVNKYIFNAQQNNPIDIAALDKQIRTQPLYSEAKSTLAKVNTFGDQYAYGSPDWQNPQGPSPYEPPDLTGMYEKTRKDIEDISL